MKASNPSMTGRFTDHQDGQGGEDGQAPDKINPPCLLPVYRQFLAH